MRSFTYIISISVLLLFSIAAHAVTYNFKIYSVEEGLPQSQVQSIFQDSKGYLWIGTIGGGLTKFDGNLFHTFNEKQGLTYNIVEAICEDQYSNLFVGTTEGLVYFDRYKFSKTFSDNNEIASIAISTLLTSQKNDIIVGTSGEGLKILIADTEQETPFYNILDFTVDNGLNSNVILATILDSKNQIWIGTDKGLNKLILDESSQVGYKIEKEMRFPELKDATIRAITEDSEGNLWLGTTMGIYKLDIHNLNNEIQTNYFDKNSGLIGNNVSAVVTDNKGRIWVGTGDGVSVLENDYLTNTYSITNITVLQGLSNNQVYSMYKDREGNIWIGTDAGGINKIDGLRFISITDKDGLKNKIVMSILEDDDHNLWFSTLRGGIVKCNISEMLSGSLNENTMTIYSKGNKLYDDASLESIKDSKGNLIFLSSSGIYIYDGKNFSGFNSEDIFDNYRIREFLEDKDGNFWFASVGGGIYKTTGFTSKKSLKIIKHYTTENGLPSNIVRVAFADSEGNLWFGTPKGGLKITDGIISVFTVEDGLSNNRISSFVEDHEGNIWIGTYGGVNKFEDEQFTIYDEKDGLAASTVYSLIFDDLNNLWIGTNGGLYQMNIRDYDFSADIIDPKGIDNKRQKKPIIRHFGKTDGFIGVECNQGSVYKDQSGNIWFGTIGGAIKYNAKEDQPNYSEPQTNITHQKLFYRDTILKDSVVLPYYSNHLTFDFVGICFKNPKKVKYQYMLEGFDKSWSPMTFVNTATYSNLPPGEFCFKVKSCNNEGVWNWEPSTFKFTITPSFWQTWLFYFLSFLTITVSIYGFVLWRIRNLKAAKKFLEEKVEASTKKLSTQHKKLKIAYKELEDEKLKVEEVKKEIEDKNKKLWGMNTEIHKEKGKVEEINNELEKLSIVAQKTLNSILIADASGEIEWVNEAFTKSWGYTLEEYKKERGNSFIEVSENENIVNLLNECMNEKKSVVYEVQNTTKSGEKKWFQTTLTPILDESENLKKIIAIDTDISELKAAEERRVANTRRLWSMSLKVNSEKEKVEEIKRLLEEKNRHITDSISYAQTIQSAILPPNGELTDVFPESFIIYKPKDIVSGDFYWFSHINRIPILKHNVNKETGVFVIAACDCTGHGVPGAFMSMIGNDLLNQAVIEKAIIDPAQILTSLHQGIITALRQEKEDPITNDGMDAAVCAIDLNNQQLVYAGARRPLILFKNGEIESIPANFLGIGGEIEFKREFLSHKIEIKKGDTFYVFSDGYTDQFGGPRDKKYTIRRLRGKLAEIQSSNMKNQKIELEKDLEEWQGSQEQIDDIMIIGVRV